MPFALQVKNLGSGHQADKINEATQIIHNIKQLDIPDLPQIVVNWQSTQKHSWVYMMSKENLIITPWLILSILLLSIVQALFLKKLCPYFLALLWLKTWNLKQIKMSFRKYQWYGTRKIRSRYSKKKLKIFP